MAALLAGLVWVCLIASLLWRAVRQFAAFRSASLAGLTPQRAPPSVLPDTAVIVPARNEIGNIADCLACLSAQRGFSAGSSIIVVDDGSQDGTADAVAGIARGDPRIALVDPGQLPAGWLGKSHACWRGALAAQTPWLCFVDADVRAAPELLRRAIRVAEQYRIDMLSLSPFQQLGSFWERLIIPAGLVLVACVQDLRLINDPAAPEISANGQFILIRRASYFAVGGHRAVRGEICEDKALAAAVKRAGLRFRMLGAENLAQTRMYTDLASLWEGLSKNAIDITGRAVTTVAAATAAMVLAWAALLLPLLSGIVAMRLASAVAIAGFALALAGSTALAGVQIGAARHFRIPAVFGLLFPFAYTTIAVLAWHGAGLRRGGRVTWKGRTYELDRKA
jgi:chlorobactene glucosyltransferase